MNIGGWLAHWAHVEPDREAIVDLSCDRRFTYHDLESGAAKASRWLTLQGIQAGQTIAILAQNRVGHVELLFACARKQIILVPLNWRLAAPELAFILTDCDPALILVENELAHLLPAGHPGVIPLEAIAPWSIPDGQDGAGNGVARTGKLASDAELVHSLLDPLTCDPGTDSDPLMILYTSGTTGRPKGALLTHRSVTFNSINTTLSWDLSGRDSTLTHTPFFHTGGWNVLTLPLLHRGGRVLMTPRFNPEETLDLVDKERITILFAVPTMYEMMMRSDNFGSTTFESLRFAISGGAPCPEEIHTRFRERGIQFKQGYGLTEVGPNCFSISLSDAARFPQSVGYPIHNERIRLVDAAGLDVTRGEVGELWLSGPHVFGGYWKNPQATVAAFPDGWFRTGDLAQQDEEGRTFIVGRRKEMFISGGENVYPAEVERVILSHPAIQQAAVFGLPDPKWGEVGCAVLVREKGQNIENEALKSHCSLHLARYKIPKRFEFVEVMPLTATGKIAKAELQKTYSA